jgi:predicted O-methyltransferase YrrM
MRGNFVGWRAIGTDVPRALAGAVVRRVAGRYPVLPWIPYPAIRHLATIAKPEWRVLEHGSGMSTVWWAKHVAHVEAIEANPDWRERVVKKLAKQGTTNVNIELRTDDSYADLTAYADRTFDLVVIDGHAREVVASQAARVVKRPGWIYLDNSDFAAQWHEMYGEAEATLLKVADDEQGTATYFTGLAPATVNTSQGLLVSLPE